MEILSMNKKRKRNLKVLITAFFSIALLAIAGTFYLQSFILKEEYVSANTKVSVKNLAKKGYRWTQDGRKGVDLAHCGFSQRNKTGSFTCNTTGNATEQRWANDIKVKRADWIRNHESGAECWIDGKKRSTSSPYFTNNSKVLSSKCSNIDDKLHDAMTGNNGNPYDGWHYPTLFTYRVTINGDRYQGYGYCTSDNGDATTADSNIDKVKYRVVEVISDETKSDEGSCVKKRKVKARLQVYIITKSGKQNVLSDWRNDGKYKRGSIVVTAEEEVNECEDCYKKEPDESKWPQCDGSNGPCCKPDNPPGNPSGGPGSSDFSVSINENLLFAGEGDVNSSLTVKTKATKDLGKRTGSYPEDYTEVKEDTHDVYLVQFAIPDGKKAGGGFGAADAPGISDTSGLIGFVNGRIGGIISGDGHKQIASINNIKGSQSKSTSAKSVAPDLIDNKSAVGGKYCVAALETTTHHVYHHDRYPVYRTDSEGNRVFVRYRYEIFTTNDFDPKLSRASNVECRPIAKRPYYQVENASAFSAGDVSTFDTSDKQVGLTITGNPDSSKKRKFGSWAEYLLVVDGSVNKVTSGATLANGIIADPLTIANKNGLGNANVDSTNFAEAITNYYAYGYGNSEVTNMSGGTISDVGNFGGKQVLISSGGVTINGNINADGGSFSPNNVTQHIIIVTDGDINITKEVSQIDAWLIAPNGNINTCDGAKPEDCGDPQLVINGLVAANSIDFERAAGMETRGTTVKDNDAAEKVVFSPLSYLWGYQQSGVHTGQTGTVFIRELAPRQ